MFAGTAVFVLCFGCTGALHIAAAAGSMRQQRFGAFNAIVWWLWAAEREMLSIHHHLLLITKCLATKGNALLP